MGVRWGNGRIRHAHRRRDDDLRVLAGLLYFAIALLAIVVVRPL